MTKDRLVPDYIFESSWEVCNKVGGIYTVLSTRAKTLQDMFPDRIIFIGPDVWKQQESPYFKEDKKLLADWQAQAAAEGLGVRVGRWQVPSAPIAVLVDFEPFYAQKNEIYTRLWELYGVDSLHSYGDYDEASMFSYAAGRVVESLYKTLAPLSSPEGDTKAHKTIEAPSGAVGGAFIYHANEWMTGLGLLYVKHRLPQIGTIFTTHATSIGRSIASNNKPLYDYLFAYNGDQMAQELNVESKHSIEKQTAHNADCFTTVSDITAKECLELLDKDVDVVLPNGFEDNFVPKGATFTRKRKAARRQLLKVANTLLSSDLNDDVLIISISGRFEYRNKGIDVFLEAMRRLADDDQLQRTVLAFVMVPGCHMDSFDAGKVKVVFLPCYLTGDDGLVDMTYYDVVLGNDLCIYPSYYEPWGYTPLEAVAFHVPCITTDLAGFGLWANSVFGHEGEISDGVKVIHRTDYNFHEVVDAVRNTVVEFVNMSDDEVKKARKNAHELSKKALWKEFVKYYLEAYDVALSK